MGALSPSKRVLGGLLLMTFIFLGSELPREIQQQVYGTLLDGESFKFLSGTHNLSGGSALATSSKSLFPLAFCARLELSALIYFKSSATPLKRGALWAPFESHLTGTSCRTADTAPPA